MNKMDRIKLIEKTRGLHLSQMCRRSIFKWVCATGILILSIGSVSAQQPHPAVVHMRELGAHSDRMTNNMWEYVKAVAHSHSASTINKKRSVLIASVEDAILSVNQTNPYNGDKKLKDAVLKYLNTMYSMLRQDYAKLVDMEEVAEQSYDLMEAFLLAKKKASDKLKEAADELNEEEREFAKRNNINLVLTESEIGKNLKKAGEVMDYYNKLYLIFFKSYKQELYVMDAMDKNDLGKLEQNRLSLLKYAEQGLDDLDDLGGYSGDKTLWKACEGVLKFYKKEAGEKLPIMTDFLLKKDQFLEIKKSFDRKRPEERTQEAVDSFNAKVKEINGLSKQYNQINDELNQERKKVIDLWNKTGDGFFGKHVPK